MNDTKMGMFIWDTLTQVRHMVKDTTHGNILEKFTMDNGKEV